MAKKVFDKQKAKIWGTADYLVSRYDDIETATVLSRKTKDATAVRQRVAAIRTDKDNLAVHGVYRTAGMGPDGPVTGLVAWISFGLNGHGAQADYFAALQKLVADGRFFVFDASVDACDDVADVLCRYKPAEHVICAPDGCRNCDHRKQRGRTAPCAGCGNCGEHSPKKGTK